MLVIHKDWVLYLQGDDNDLTVTQVGTAVQNGVFTEIHVNDMCFFKKAVEQTIGPTRKIRCGLVG